MSNRIHIQQLYDIASKKYPHYTNKHVIYDENKKQIKYISKVFLKTIKDFSNTLKIKQNDGVENINCEYYYKVLECLKQFIKNDELDEAIETLSNVAQSIDFIFCFESHKEHGLFGLIEENLCEYIYFMLLSIDKNIKIEKNECVSEMFIIYDGIKYTKEDPLYEQLITCRSKKIKYDCDKNYVYFHDFHFFNNRINENLKNKLNFIIREYKYLYDVKFKISISEDIENELFDINYIKEHCKKYFKLFYSTYYVIMMEYVE